MSHTILMTATLMAIRSRNEVATRQLLRLIDSQAPNPESAIIRLYNTLENPSKQWLKATIAPGLKRETYSEGASRISKNSREI